MSIPEWEEIGIPSGYGPFRLLYNSPSEIVIAELRSVGAEFSPNRIYIRHKDSPRYEPIKSFEPTVDYESVITSQGRPLLFYLSGRLKKIPEGYSGDWEGLYSFDLVSKADTKIAGTDSLLLPPPFNRGWVSSLVSASEDGSGLHLVVAMMQADDSQRFNPVIYQLARMDLATKRLDFITQLKGAFF